MFEETAGMVRARGDSRNIRVSPMGNPESLIKTRILRCIVLCMALIIIAGVSSVAGDLPQAVDSGFCDLTGGSIYYEVFGKGIPFVMIHDGIIHRVVWDAQVAAFADRFRVIRLDRRGYGKSEQPTTPYSEIDDLHDLLKSLNANHIVLMGSSAGGGLAIDFTLAHPEMVDVLLLTGAVVNGLGYSFHFANRTYANYSTDPDTLVNNWVNDTYQVAPGNTRARELMREILTANPQNLDFTRYQWWQLPERCALGRLSEIKIPTLIMTGEHDTPDAQAHAGAIQAGIQGARRIVIPDAGHLVCLEQPEAFNAAVSEFLSLTSLSQASTSEGLWNTYRRGFAPVNNSVLYYEVLGNGPPVVLIHGGGLDHRMWDDQFAIFARDYQVIRYDVRAHGLSPDPYGDRRDYDDLRDLLKYLEIEKAHLVGLSLGGGIIFDFCLMHPDMVLSAIAVSCAVSGYQFADDNFTENQAKMAEAYFAGDYHQATDWFQRSWTDGPHRNPEEVPKHVRERVHAMAYEGLLPGKTNGRALPPDPPALGRLSEIHVPAMLILGELDFPSIHEIMSRIRDEVSGARLVTIPGAAHMVNMEYPEQFNQVVLEFLGK